MAEFSANVLEHTILNYDWLKKAMKTFKNNGATPPKEVIKAVFGKVAAEWQLENIDLHQASARLSFFNAERDWPVAVYGVYNAYHKRDVAQVQWISPNALGGGDIGEHALKAHQQLGGLELDTTQALVCATGSKKESLTDTMAVFTFDPKSKKSHVKNMKASDIFPIGAQMPRGEFAEKVAYWFANAKASGKLTEHDTFVVIVHKDTKIYAVHGDLEWYVDFQKTQTNDTTDVKIGSDGSKGYPSILR